MPPFLCAEPSERGLGSRAQADIATAASFHQPRHGDMRDTLIDRDQRDGGADTHLLVIVTHRVDEGGHGASGSGAEVA